MVQMSLDVGGCDGDEFVFRVFVVDGLDDNVLCCSEGTAELIRGLVELGDFDVFFE